jgi:hypothetical protein
LKRETHERRAVACPEAGGRVDVVGEGLRGGSGWRRGLTEVEARTGMGVGDGQRGAAVTNVMPWRKKPPRKNCRGYTRAGKELLGEKNTRGVWPQKGRRKILHLRFYYGPTAD